MKKRRGTLHVPPPDVMERRQRLRAAMASLVQNTNFHEFMDTIAELREGAVSYAVLHSTVEGDRKTIAALGEVAAYDDILDVYRSHIEPVANGEDELQV